MISNSPEYWARLMKETADMVPKVPYDPPKVDESTESYEASEALMRQRRD